MNHYYIYRKYPSGRRGSSLYLYWAGDDSWVRSKTDAWIFSAAGARTALTMAKSMVVGQSHQPKILKPTESK